MQGKKNARDAPQIVVARSVAHVYAKLWSSIKSSRRNPPSPPTTSYKSVEVTAKRTADFQ